MVAGSAGLREARIKPAMSAPLLKLSGIAKSFGAVRALKGVSFDLQAGEIHALLGENGAGKSTLIKIITGAHEPDQGTISLQGAHVERLSPRAAHRLGIACIYQQPALFPDLTVAENIGLRLESPGLLRRVNWKARRAKAEELLRRIGSGISPESEVRELSMPEQQLVEIACAIATGARIVIMDEPTASLTQKEQHLLFAVARELRSSGVGIIYISHRLEEIFALADRVTVLRDGQSVGTNRIDEINETELIRMMVGREIDQIYPEAENTAGHVVLEARQLGCAASGVRNVSFELRAGEVLGVAGLVGAGRTELARALFGITLADSGEILLNGEKVLIHSPPEAIGRGIAYVPEDRRRHGVVLEMALAANVAMASLPNFWMNFARENSVADEFIRNLSVKTSGSDALAGSLSGGNQQKISLARWLATEPKILILDEPTQGVDVGAKSEIHKIIRNLAARGIAVLMISSDLPEVIGMSDRIAVMRQGTIVAMLPGKSSAHDVMTAALGARVS
jgi:rhamnose transport system ATP-binding protein